MMPSRILKGFAVAAGAGLAAGFSRGRKRQSLSMNHSDSMDNDDPKLIARLERIEDRLDAFESNNRRTLESVLEKTLAPYVETLRARLQIDIRESMDTRLNAFEQAIDQKVSNRVAALEKVLIDQSTIITTLSQRAVEAEENFQRLISAVERLFAQREGAPAGKPVISPAAFETSFEKQLNDALQAGPVVVPEGFRPRIVSEKEAKHSQHRRPLSKL
jgi:primosomal protein N'